MMGWILIQARRGAVAARRGVGAGWSRSSTLALPAFDWGPWGTLASLGAAAVLGVAALRMTTGGEQAPPPRGPLAPEMTVLKGEARHDPRMPAMPNNALRPSAPAGTAGTSAPAPAVSREELQIYIVNDEDGAVALHRWLGESANIAAAAGGRAPGFSVIAVSGPEDEDRVQAYVADLNGQRVLEQLLPVTVIDVRAR